MNILKDNNRILTPSEVVAVWNAPHALELAGIVQKARDREELKIKYLFENFE